MLPAALINIVGTAIGVAVIQGVDGWRQAYNRSVQVSSGLGLTATGKAIAIGLASSICC
jgi:hypothetical protein